MAQICSTSSGGLIGIAYLPHGTMLLDLTREDLPDGVKSLHSCCMKISEKIAQLNPDLIILLTPHGINLHQAFNIYQPAMSNCNAYGNAEWNHQWMDYNVNIELDGDSSQDLYLHLKNKLPNIQRMASFGGLSTPLRWGEVVPLYFALHQLASKKETNSTRLKQISIQSPPKIVIIAQPAKGTTSSQNLYSLSTS